MKIKELYVENFGKLSKYKLTFSDTLNSFVEDNGYGKTTVTVFIKAMLYGFDDSRRHSLDENERKKYTPWQGGAFGGYLTINVDNKCYRIERSFGQKPSDDTFTLYDLNTGAVSNDYSSNLGEELFGIDADGFERTVFLSEKNLSGKNTNQTISAKLSNLVGTEGDIGGFDNAIKLLDDRRRFYQKKGGAGEIQDVMNEISELEDRIKELYIKRDSSAASEAEIIKLSEQIQSLKASKESIMAKERHEMLEKEKRGYEIQYAEMLGALRLDETREEELLSFFEKKIPTNAEVAMAAESASETKRLNRTLADIGENAELKSLKEFFRGGEDQAICDKMASDAKKISEQRATILNYDKSINAEPIFKTPPTRADIERKFALLDKAQSYNPIGAIIILILGFLISGAGIFSGLFIKNILFSVSLIGVLLIFVSIISLLKSSGGKESARVSNEILDYINEIYNEKRTFASAFSALTEARADLEKSIADEERNKILKNERATLEENVVKLERAIREFCESFPEADGLTLEEKTEVISYKRRRFSLLMEYEAETEHKRAEILDKMKKHSSSLESFISLFPTVTDDPISEIRRNLAEYEVIRSSLTHRRRDAERFALLHGINYIPDIRSDARMEINTDFSREISALEEKLIELEREKTRLESEYSIFTREIDSIDELEEKLREKQEKIEIFRNNLWVINKAKDMLAKSKDSMTAKYLDSTKHGFNQYLSMFDDAIGEFTIDTSFSLMKTDLGKSRQAEAYSRGTRDLHALAMRLALTDALYGDNTPPIILDDPFTAFDDGHIERAAAVIKKLSAHRQIFYFTCSKSRKIKS